MGDWQHIETAPAGEDILLCWPAGTMRVGYNNGHGWLCDGESFETQPVYWMPLPKPPRLNVQVTQ
jgi:hypothetical protein